jgi:hypothetical protein
MVQQIIKTSPHGSFTVTQLCENIVICEDINDKQGWGNATKNKPAFLVYFGCQKDEVSDYVEFFNHLYGCEWCEVRKPKYLKQFESEIKIKGMTRNSLNYLVKKQIKSLVNFDLSDEILEAAQLLKDDQDLLGETEAIAKVICQWIEDQLNDITWEYPRSSTLQKGIFEVELNHEKALTQ